MKKLIFALACLLLFLPALFAQTSETKTDSTQKKDSAVIPQKASDPFAFGDFSCGDGSRTWSRQETRSYSLLLSGSKI
jgi:hypothetical protein